MAIRSTTISLILLLSVSCFGLDSLMAQEQGVSEGHQNPFVVRCRFYHDNNNNYYYKIIENALTLTEDQYGPFLLESIDIRISSTIRKVKEIQSSRLYNLESIPVTKQLEEELYAIPFPLFGGLFGLRVLISHLNSIDALQQSKTIDDLRQFTFGHGKDWSDTEIFRQNQISVEVGDNSENLYKMLMKQRFDCFPRSFMEYQYELKLYHSKEIQLVEPFFIYYPYPNYFFVSHENKDIGDRILKGLQRSVQNGSYDMLLNQYYGKELLMLSRENRPVIQIENSFISDETIETLNHYILPDLKRLLGIHSHQKIVDGAFYSLMSKNREFMNTGSKFYLSILPLLFYSFSSVILFAEEQEKPELIPVKENSMIRYYGGDIGFIYEVLMNAIYLTQDTHGILEIKSMHMNLGSTKRKVMEIKSARSFDIAPLPAMIQPDEELLMIPFPIHQGMFGVRVLIAHQDSIQALESCMTLDDLKRFTFGHGKDWSDTAILQHNQIPVVLGDSAQNLYHMLLKQRFDCFPRAIEEVHTEKQRYRLIDTKTVESFYVYYPYIVCYFVSRENQAFADRLLKGLQQSFHDGSYQKILHYYYQEELLQLSQQKKRVIHLENPFLSEKALQLVQTYMMPELKSLLDKE